MALAFHKSQPCVHREAQVCTNDKVCTNDDGVYKYNTITNKSAKIIDYPNDFMSVGHIPTIDSKII